MKPSSNRAGLILAGLYLSKFGKEGLARMGFSSFIEAFNTMGYALGGKPNSVKNYMQEFDPLFPNGRKGWHKRNMREHCRVAYERYAQHSLDDYLSVILPMLTIPPVLDIPEGMEELAGVVNDDIQKNDGFAKRLITGIAAEKFFEESFSGLTEFNGHAMDNVTRFGCGFDFRVQHPDGRPYLAIEVKGLAATYGEIQMTNKEHRVAEYLRDRYFLCVVRNFADSPVISLFQNPLMGQIKFQCRESLQPRVTWHARITA